MKATELIGKLAIRTARTNMIGDGSYTSEPVLIVYADDSHIGYEHTGYMAKICTGVSIMDKDFCDNNWRSYDALKESIDEGLKTLELKLKLGSIFV